jgi:hypothetical protein
MTCFQSLTVQSSCSMTNSSLCLLILLVRWGFWAIFINGNFRVFQQLLWLGLTPMFPSSGIFLFSCRPVSVWVIFSFLFMLSRVAMDNLEGQPQKPDFLGWPWQRITKSFSLVVLDMLSWSLMTLWGTLDFQSSCIAENRSWLYSSSPAKNNNVYEYLVYCIRVKML